MNTKTCIQENSNSIKKITLDLVKMTFVTEKHKTCFMFLSDEGPMLETLGFTICIDSTPTFLYFDLYLNTAYAAHCVY